MIFFGLRILVILSNEKSLLRLIHRWEREREIDVLNSSDLNFDIFIIILPFKYM